MTRLDRYLLPTEREAPADAEALSHKLMVRAGLVRVNGARPVCARRGGGWRHARLRRMVTATSSNGNGIGACGL